MNVRRVASTASIVLGVLFIVAALGTALMVRSERDDPRRETAMQASFLRASLSTSVVDYGIAAMAAAMGVVFILIGLGMRDVSRHLEADTLAAPPEPATT